MSTFTEDQIVTVATGAHGTEWGSDASEVAAYVAEHGKTLVVRYEQDEDGDIGVGPIGDSNRDHPSQYILPEYLIPESEFKAGDRVKLSSGSPMGSDVRHLIESGTEVFATIVGPDPAYTASEHGAVFTIRLADGTPVQGGGDREQYGIRAALLTAAPAPEVEPEASPSVTPHPVGTRVRVLAGGPLASSISRRIEAGEEFFATIDGAPYTRLDGTFDYPITVQDPGGFSYGQSGIYHANLVPVEAEPEVEELACPCGCGLTISAVGDIDEDPMDSDEEDGDENRVDLVKTLPAAGRESHRHPAPPLRGTP